LAAVNPEDRTTVVASGAATGKAPCGVRASRTGSLAAGCDEARASGDAGFPITRSADARPRRAGRRPRSAMSAICWTCFRPSPQPPRRDQEGGEPATPPKPRMPRRRIRHRSGLGSSHRASMPSRPANTNSTIRRTSIKVADSSLMRRARPS